MKVLPIINYNPLNQTNSGIRHNDTNYNNYSTKSINPNFKGICSPKIILVLVLKAIKDIKEDITFLNRKKSFNNFLNNPKEHINNANKILNLISNTPNKREHSFSYMFRNDPYDKLPEMRKRVLTEVFPIIPDKNSFIYTKKEFLTKLFDAGEYNNKNFIDCFRSLPDEIYGNFKESIAEKVLFSRDVYPTNSKAPVKLYDIYNHYILDSLNQKNHKQFIKNNKSYIKLLDKKLQISGKRLITEKKDMAYKYYINDFLPVNTDEYKLWQPLIKSAFFDSVQAAEKNYVKLAKDLNVNQNIAKSIIDDYLSFHEAGRANTKQKKLKIYIKRINEKFKNPIQSKYKWYTFDSSHEEIELTNLLQNSKDIDIYIKRTGYEKELKEYFKNKINNLNRQLHESQKAFDKTMEMNSYYDAEVIDRTGRV